MDRTEAPELLLARLQAINETAAFNRWCGIELLEAQPGSVAIALRWRPELGQYAGFLHAGLIGALIDTACGYAAATLVGRVLAAHYAVNCLRPAVGRCFVARARVVKPGRTQVFTACELFAQGQDGESRLVATGETLLSVVAGDPQ
ncbi:PaaI family thioesterase [Roseateles violae]|uniref:PaaI family thioesterase n=1 Tax=Roseateles violae TaxID=3058042 RepID=A0ABT8DTC5_9BURK|nr:PaaI family thioesterase [Pelomonas sp. PFR6]MDN3921321.1 PaaI family thioesterase [Pelomonas sp. PFR6]